MTLILYYSNHKNRNKILTLILLIILFMSFNSFTFESQNIFLFENKIPVYSNYILTKTECGGIGNQLFRFAIIYGIGRNLSRTPIFDKNEKCEMDSLEELKQTFPHLFDFIKVLKPSRWDTVIAEPFFTCCNFSRVENITKKYLIFEGYTPFPIGFFHKYKSEVKYLLKYDSKLMNEVEQQGKEIFENDNSSSKLCIHFRRGDFFKTRFVESREDFIVPASIFIKSYLYSKTNISVILFGKDDIFVETLKTQFNNTILNTVFTPNLKTRSHDLAFSSLFCDSLLISSSGSTFAWWIGYLLDPKVPIFYNNNVLKNGRYSNDDFLELYPPEWIRLNVELNNTVKIIN